MVKGKWKSTSGQKGDELVFNEVVEIDCFEQLNKCIEAQAQVVAGAPDVAINLYDVLRWDRNGIIAEDATARCVTSQLNINFQLHTVIAVDAPKTAAKDFKDSCKATQHTRTFHLVDR